MEMENTTLYNRISYCQGDWNKDGGHPMNNVILKNCSYQMTDAMKAGVVQNCPNGLPWCPNGPVKRKFSNILSDSPYNASKNV